MFLLEICFSARFCSGFLSVEIWQKVLRKPLHCFSEQWKFYSSCLGKTEHETRSKTN